MFFVSSDGYKELCIRDREWNVGFKIITDWKLQDNECLNKMLLFAVSENYGVFLTVSIFLCQDAILSPVQDGENKPQIDSNQENNYELVKKVSFVSLFCWFYTVFRVICFRKKIICLLLDPGSLQ